MQCNVTIFYMKYAHGLCCVETILAKLIKKIILEVSNSENHQ